MSLCCVHYSLAPPGNHFQSYLQRFFISSCFLSLRHEFCLNDAQMFCYLLVFGLFAYVFYSVLSSQGHHTISQITQIVLILRPLLYVLRSRLKSPLQQQQTRRGYVDTFLPLFKILIRSFSLDLKESSLKKGAQPQQM